MYHLSTGTTGKWNIVGDYKNILEPSGFVLPFNYRTEVPFELFLCTSLPDNPNARLIIMQSSPSSSLYTSFSNAEIAPYIDNGKLHQHDFFELMFVIEGTVYQNIEYERHVYPAGSCCLINTNTQHIEEYHNYIRGVPRLRRAISCAASRLQPTSSSDAERLMMRRRISWS